MDANNPEEYEQTTMASTETPTQMTSHREHHRRTNFRYLPDTGDHVEIDSSLEMPPNPNAEEPFAQSRKRRADGHDAKTDCRWAREPSEVVAETGLGVRDASTARFDATTTAEMTPDRGDAR